MHYEYDVPQLIVTFLVPDLQRWINGTDVSRGLTDERMYFIAPDIIVSRRSRSQKERNDLRLGGLEVVEVRFLTCEGPWASD